MQSGVNGCRIEHHSERIRAYLEFGFAELVCHVLCKARTNGEDSALVVYLLGERFYLYLCAEFHIACILSPLFAWELKNYRHHNHYADTHRVVQIGDDL